MTAPESARALRVFFFGDSICFGQGVSLHKTWVSRLSAMLSERFEGRANVIVQNPSINGNTTRQGLERMAFDVQSHRPHVLIVQFGLNDCNVWQTDCGHQRVSPEAFTANLTEMVSRGRRFGARRVILVVNHPTTRTTDLLPETSVSYEESNRSYNRLIRAVAKDVAAEIVDMEASFLTEVAKGRAPLETLLLPDQLHLSEKGHDLYYNNFTKLLTNAAEQTFADLCNTTPD